MKTRMDEGLVPVAAFSFRLARFVRVEFSGDSPAGIWEFAVAN